jgi:hypothetical protein
VLCMSVPLGVCTSPHSITVAPPTQAVIAVCRYSAWLNVLNINLQSFNFSQQDSGWVGFGSSLAGT